MVCVLAGAVLWMYGGILSSLARQWASDDNYSHGFFVVPLVLYFMWERRASLKAASLAPSLAGALVVALSLCVLLAGLLGAELFLTRISLIGVLAGTVLYVWGRHHLRILAFPLAFLLLMIPLPAIIFNQIAFPLQLLASRVGELAIGLARNTRCSRRQRPRIAKHAHSKSPKPAAAFARSCPSSRWASCWGTLRNGASADDCSWRWRRFRSRLSQTLRALPALV